MYGSYRFDDLLFKDFSRTFQGLSTIFKESISIRTISHFSSYSKKAISVSANNVIQPKDRIIKNYSFSFSSMELNFLSKETRSLSQVLCRSPHSTIYNIHIYQMWSRRNWCFDIQGILKLKRTTSNKQLHVCFPDMTFRSLSTGRMCAIASSAPWSARSDATVTRAMISSQQKTCMELSRRDQWKDVQLLFAR